MLTMKLSALAKIALLSTLPLLAWGELPSPACAQGNYDVVIANGRAMDPESGLDAVRNVGIIAGKIRAISSAPLNGKTRIDAKGLVVAPGFIDLHEHGQ